MWIAGEPTVGRVRGIDPERAYALAGSLSRTGDAASALSLQVRRSLSLAGTTSVAAGRVESVGRWAHDQATDVLRRIRVITERREAAVARLTLDLGSMYRDDLVCDPDPHHAARFFDQIHPDDLRWLGSTYPGRLAHLEGAPPEVRYAANRQLILADVPAAEAAVARAQQAVALATSTTPWSHEEAVALLVAERIARRQLVEAEAWRDSLYAWSAEDRQILGYRDDDGGRLIEVLGDLGTARHVAVALPGVTNTPLTYEAQHRPNVVALAGATAGLDTAVVSFLYDAPDSLLGGTGSAAASQGGRELAELVRDLATVGPPDAHRTVVAHSYGSVTTGHGLAQTDLGDLVDDVVVLGSPGLGVDHVSDLPERVRVWAAAADGDLIPLTPFHDRDPASGVFGATRFDTGDAHGHSGYYTDPASLANIAAVVTSRHDLVEVIPQASEPTPSPSGRGY